MPPKTNAEGKTYPWAIEGKDFAAVESAYKYSCFITAFADMIGKKEAMTDLSGEIIQEVEENPSFLEDVKQNKIVGGREKSLFEGYIKISDMHQGYTFYCTPEQKESMYKLLRILHNKFPKATIHGHREFANKACPCFNVLEDAEIAKIFQK